jgi:rubrerythrin
MANQKKFDINDIGIFDVCCQIEETCADLYRYFANLFIENLQASKLWTKTAMEEDNHAEHFRLAARIKGKGLQSINTELFIVNNLLNKIQSVYEGVQKSPPPLKEALRFAIKLENSMLEYHMNAIAKFEDKKTEQLFAAMMDSDKQHIQMLERAFNEM